MMPYQNSINRTFFLSLLGVSLWVTPVLAQSLDTIKPTSEPLVLQNRGSFYVGGESVEQNSEEVGFGPKDKVTTNQMYVEYMIPSGLLKVPVIMVHGATLSGKTYDTTPDGRMGWFEYFVRKTHPVYVVDQVGRARSGFNQSIFNTVRAGKASPDTQPNIFRLADQFGSWTNFRFGPSPGVPFPDTQFPVEAAAELSKQSVPDLSATLASPNPTPKALSSLTEQLKGAILLSHSQSGPFPLDAALIDAESIKAMVLVEPGTCRANVFTDQQIATLAKVPTLIVFGDYLPSPTGVPGPTWQDRFEECQTFISRVKKAGGTAEMLFPPEIGIKGNSHMLMQDKNNLQIADLILTWLDKNVQPNSSQ